MALQLIDDFTGEPLDRDHEALTVRIGLQGWNLYLSDSSKDALFKALEPFTNTAEPIETVRAAMGSSSPRKSTSTRAARNDVELNTYGADAKDVRAWAQANGVNNVLSNGDEKPVADRGRLTQAVYDAYHKATSNS